MCKSFLFFIPFVPFCVTMRSKIAPISFGFSFNTFCFCTTKTRQTVGERAGGTRARARDTTAAYVFLVPSIYVCSCFM
uniref:Putative secreted peptide n=1 Tax=Anopheles braziliensis TaxID=58242 RepID=A0A2M3ZRQ9_9DIPT